MSILPLPIEIPYTPTPTPGSIISPSPTLLDYKIGEIIDVALYALREAGSQPIEWGALLECRMQVPRVVKDFCYIIDDEKIELASDLLERIGLPLMPATEFTLDTEGDFRAKGRFHSITRKIDSFPWTQHLVLYPRSFIPLLTDELEEVPATHLMSPGLSPQIVAPKPPAAYAALMRMLLAYPYLCTTRTVIKSSLRSLLNYHLLGFEDGCCINAEDEDEYWATHYPEREEEAIATLRQWKCEGAWADGEDWIGDALAAFINGSGDMWHLSLSRRR